MKEQLISFETAKLAKEKGFNIETDKYWCNYYTGEPGQKWKLLNKSELTGSFLNLMEWAAPTQSLLQKWLREIHDITIWFSDWEINEYSVHICQKEETKYMPNKSLGSYEQALEIGLQESLKLIES